MKNSFNDLKGKVCVITGGYGVIGMSLCRGFASVGTKLAILGRNIEKAEAAAKEITATFGVEAIGVKADVIDKQSVEAANEVIKASLGSVDILVNCAGGNAKNATTQVEQMDASNIDELEKTFYGLESEGFDDVFSLNFKGTLIPSMVLTKDMLKKGGGVVLNISSMNAFKPLTKIPAYSAAKAAVNNFNEWLATHLAKVNIRVNAVAPGFFITDQNRFLVTKPDGTYSDRGQKIVNNTPMGKFGDTDDLIGASLFLCSETSSFITGICIPVDGGYNAFSGV